MSYFNTIQFPDSANFDAFGCMRVSNPTSMYDSAFHSNLRTLTIASLLTNGGTFTHVPNYSSALLAVTSTTGSRTQVMSRRYLQYQPGKSQLIKMTQIFGTKVANVIKRAGYFDLSDGVYFEVNGTTDLAFCIRTSTSGTPSDTNRVAQANWNLDKLNGAGASGVTLDVTKANILVIDLQWLGMGRVRVGFNIGGALIYCHQFLNANTTLSVPYMKTANLPVYWEIINNAGGAGDNTFYATCAAVVSEGGFETTRSVQFSTSNPSDISIASGARTHLLSIRAAELFNSISTVYALIEEISHSVINLGSTNPLLVEIIYNPTVTGGSWVAADTKSAVEVNSSATYSTGGTIIDSTFVSAASKSQFATSVLMSSRLPRCKDPLALTYTPIVYSIIASGIGGTSTGRAALNWNETK